MPTPPKKYKLVLKTVYIWIMSLFLTAILAFGLKGIESLFSEDSLPVNLVDSFKGDWYINTFFSFQNLNNPQGLGDSAIEIIDIKDTYSSRDSIICVIEKVRSLHPRLICVDFMFSQSTSYDSAQSVRLEEYFNRIKHDTPLVFTGYKGLSDSVSSSFFVKSLNLDIALADFTGFSRYVPYIDSIPRISAYIAQKSGINLSRIPSPMVTNYRNKEFGKLTIRDGNDVVYYIRRPIIENKIVLIGQNDTPDDIHTTPFIINNKKQITGLEEIAYEVSSVLSPFSKTFSPIRSPYVSMTWGYNICLFVLLFSIYIILLHIMKRLNNDGLKLLLKPILLITAEFTLIFICFEITKRTCQIPNVVLFATSLLFVEFAFEFSIYSEKYIKNLFRNIKNNHNQS